MQQRVTPKSLIAENKRRDYGRVQNHLKVILSDPSIQPTQRTSKSAPKFLPESQDENMRQPLCIDSQGHGTRKLITKTYIKWINRTSHCHHGYPIARHTSSVLKSLKTQSDKKISKGKLNSSQEDREGKTPYDSSISTKLAIHQDHAISRTRERDQTHSYQY